MSDRERPHLPTTVLLPVILGSILVYGFSSSSPSFKVQIDAMTNGGGTSSSSSLVQGGSAIGQDLPAGVSTSSSFSNKAGVIVSSQTPLAVPDWNLY